MKKTYIFKTKDGLHEITIRGSEGQHKMSSLEMKGKTSHLSLGGMVITINTVFETKEDLEEALLSS